MSSCENKIQLEPNPAAATPMLIFFLPIISFVVGHLIHKFHLNWLPESVGTMFVGAVSGAIHYVVGKYFVTLEFDTEVFYYVLLPIIIFESGYSMKKRGLFANLGTVLLYAIFGTLFSIFFVGLGVFYLAKLDVLRGISTDNVLESLIFGSLISSTDPVATLAIMGQVFHVGERENAPLVYNLVFGESVLNDGVAIVMYRILLNFYVEHKIVGTVDVGKGIGDFFIIAFGSIIIAFICAAAISLLLKHTNLTEHYSAEVLTIYLSAALAYCWAELLGLSGILAVFFCALFMTHYTWYNISHYAQITTKTTFKLFAHLSETVIFLILGTSPFVIIENASDAFNWSFIGWTLLLMIVARALQTVIFSAIANRKRKHKISPKTQFFIFHAGLRGSIAFSLALQTKVIGLPNSESIISCTVAVVIFTNVIMGGLTSPLLRWLDYLTEIDNTEIVPLHQGEQDSTYWVESQRKSYFAQKIKNIDMRYLKPFLTSKENHAISDYRNEKTDRGEYQNWINLF